MSSGDPVKVGEPHFQGHTCEIFGTEPCYRLITSPSDPWPEYSILSLFRGQPSYMATQLLKERGRGDGGSVIKRVNEKGRPRKGRMRTEEGCDKKTGGKERRE